MRCTAVILSLLLSVPFALGKQTSRQDVVLNSYKKRAGGLFTRQSPTPCATQSDSTGFCCPASDSGDLITIDDGTLCCPSSVYTPTCSSTACCAGGAGQILRSSVSEQCCPAGTVPDTEVQACVPTTRKRDALAFELATRPVRRDVVDDPRKQISFRPGSWRTTLSPHLVAELVMNDWSFEYRGHTFVDEASRARGKSFWQSRIAKNLPGFVKYKGADFIAKSIQKMHANGEKYLALADEYEVALDDVPLIWGALLDHPAWEGSFHLEGAKWDFDMIKRIISAHPSWNATIHDRA